MARGNLSPVLGWVQAPLVAVVPDFDLEGFTPPENSHGTWKYPFGKGETSIYSGGRDPSGSTHSAQTLFWRVGRCAGSGGRWVVTLPASIEFKRKSTEEEEVSFQDRHFTLLSYDSYDCLEEEYLRIFLEQRGKSLLWCVRIVVAQKDSTICTTTIDSCIRIVGVFKLSMVPWSRHKKSTALLGMLCLLWNCK